MATLARRTSASIERKFIEKDKIPDGFRLVYRAPMEGYVISINIVSTVTTVLVALVAGFKYNQDTVSISPHETNFIGLITYDTDIWWFIAGFVAINTLIRLFVFKYPLRIYTNSDKYIATYQSQLFLGRKQHYFNRGDVSQVRNPINPWSDMTYRLGNRNSILLLDYFKTPSEFHEMTTKPTE